MDCGAFEGRCACEEGVEDAAEGPEVGLEAVGLVLDYFGRDVVRCTTQGLPLFFIRSELDCQSKIYDLYFDLPSQLQGIRPLENLSGVGDMGDKDIRELKISMHHPKRLHIIQPRTYLTNDLRHRYLRHDQGSPLI